MNSTSLYNSTNPCAIDGQPDIYGLGIRISLYLQWYAAILAYIYSRKEAGVAITANYLIAIAVGIACMVHYGQIYSLEVIIIAILMMVPPLALLMVLGELLLFAWHEMRKVEDREKEMEARKNKLKELAEKSRKYRGVELFVHISALLATAFLLGVMVWGFFYGPNVMEKSPEGCTPMFGDDRYLAGTYATWLRVWSVVLIALAIPTIIFFMFFRARLYSLGDKLDASNFTFLVAKFVTAEHSDSPLNTGPPVSYIRPIAAVICGVAVSTCITTIELVIYQNDIQGVGPKDLASAGQLIPLIIGLASFGLMIFEKYRTEKEKEKKNEKKKVRLQKRKLEREKEEAEKQKSLGTAQPRGIEGELPKETHHSEIEVV